LTNLLAEIWLCLVAAAFLGVVAGWLVWGRSTERIKEAYRRRLVSLRENWEDVEEQLVEALSRASELETALSDRQRDSVQREAALQSILMESEDAWKNERQLLEATVSVLDERVRTLEADHRLQGARPRYR
jgi:uncharacterized membrane-anchored protein YhcB (DUF1043 family)